MTVSITTQGNPVNIASDTQTITLNATAYDTSAVAVAAAASSSVNAISAAASAAQAALYDGPWLDDVAAVLADTALTYTTGGPSSVVAGDYVQTRKEGFAYKVAASGASDQHLVTAGGVKLYVMPDVDGAFPVAALTAVATAASIQKAFDIVNPLSQLGIFAKVKFPASAGITVGSSLALTGHPRNKPYVVGAGMMQTVISYNGASDVPVLDFGAPFTGLESTGFRTISDFSVIQLVANKTLATGIRWQSANAIGSIERVYISGFKEGIRTRDDWGNSYKNMYIFGCGTGFYSERQANGAVFENIYFQQCDTGLNLQQPWAAAVRNCIFERDTNYSVAITGGNARIESCYFEGATVGHIASVFVGSQGGEPAPAVTVADNLMNNDIGLACVMAASARELHVLRNTIVTPTEPNKPLVQITSGSSGPAHLVVEGNCIRYLPSISTPETRAFLMPLIGDEIMTKTTNLKIGANGQFTDRGTILPGTSNLMKLSTSTTYGDPAFVDNGITSAMKFFAGPQLWKPTNRTDWTISTLQGDAGTINTAAVSDGIECVDVTRTSGVWSHTTAWRSIPLSYLQGLFGTHATLAFEIRGYMKNGRIVVRYRTGSTVRTTATTVTTSATKFEEVKLVQKVLLNQDAIVEVGIRTSTTGYFAPITVEVVGLADWYNHPNLLSY